MDVIYFHTYVDKHVNIKAHPVISINLLCISVVNVKLPLQIEENYILFLLLKTKSTESSSRRRRSNKQVAC